MSVGRMQSLNASHIYSSTGRPQVAPGARRPLNAVGRRSINPAASSLGASKCYLCGKKINAQQFTPGPARSTRKGRKLLTVHARAGDVDVQDRILGALPYIVPLLDGIRYGRYFFAQFPASAQVLAPIRPLVSVYYSVPFLSLIIFFALFSGVVNNYNFSRHVRFNAMQAVLLSVLLVFPSLIEQVLRPSGSLGLQLQINLYNTIWLFVATCVAYGVGSSLLGKVARLPLIASAADQRVP